MVLLTKVGGMTFDRMRCTFFIMTGGKKTMIGARNGCVRRERECLSYGFYFLICFS